VDALPSSAGGSDQGSRSSRPTSDRLGAGAIARGRSRALCRQQAVKCTAMQPARGPASGMEASAKASMPKRNSAHVGHPALVRRVISTGGAVTRALQPRASVTAPAASDTSVLTSQHLGPHGHRQQGRLQVAATAHSGRSAAWTALLEMRGIDSSNARTDAAVVTACRELRSEVLQRRTFRDWRKWAHGVTFNHP
jgi:hypothetical protein